MQQWFILMVSGGAKPRVDKVSPKIMDYFGWCTWDAFYSTISAEGDFSIPSAYS